MSDEVEEKEIEEKKEPVLCALDDSGNFLLSNQVMLVQAAQLCIRTKLAPPHLIDIGVEAVASALLMCKQYNLPQKAMSQMAFIKGRLTVYGSLYTAIAQRHPLYGETETFYVNENFDKICVENKNLKDEAWACIMRVRPKGSKHWNEYFFSLDDAHDAGLTVNPKPSSAWKKYVKDMLYHKTKVRAYGKEYASVLEGVNYHEDVKESFEVMKDVTPGGSADIINEDIAGDHAS